MRRSFRPAAILPSVVAAVLWWAALARADSTVVFNEIMYHPLGSEAELEWIELHSQMGVDMDISLWQLQGGISFTFPEGTLVPGGGLLVVAASPSALQSASGHAGALGPFSGRLDNSGERLELLNNTGRLMDWVRYSDGGEWPAAADGSGASLAKIEPASASRPPENWTLSAAVGGTPGKPNFPSPGGPQPFPSGVISYWSLDESSGPALDLAGGNNGSLGAGAARVAGLLGSGALSFNNTSGAFVNVGTGAATSYSTTTGITVEAIIRSTWSGAAADHDEIFRKEDGDNRILLSFQNDGNQNGFSRPPVGPGPVLSFGLNVGGVYSELDMLLDGQEGRPALAFLKDGAPHHVAATYDSSTGRKAIYIDGARAFSVDFPPGSLITSGGGTSAYIGNTSARNEPFTGVIDEVAIWREALPAARIAEHFTGFQAGRDYFEGPAGPAGAARTALAFSETFSSTAAEPWIEIVNHGAQTIGLEGHVLSGPESPALEYRFPALTLPGGGYLALTRSQLGLPLLAGSRLFLHSPGRTAALDGVRIESGLRGRRVPGTGPWLFPDRPTPGAENSFSIEDAVVLNEIMYHHQPLRDGPLFMESAEAWIELYNRGTRPVALGGWSLGGGIEYRFESGLTLGPEEYLVVAWNKQSMEAIHPGIRVVGNFRGRLSHKSDRLTLLDSRGNPADEVRYHDGGRWPEYADGGGSSLELRDPRSDNSRAEAWDSSDESRKSSWRAYSYQGVAAANVGPTQWSELVLGLLDAGEVLLDDLSVKESPSGAARELLSSRDFEAGLARWRLLGNHSSSSWVIDPDDPSNHALHLVATGPTEHMHNHAETSLVGGGVVNGREYRISFRARWLGGSNRLHTRLYFNRLPRSTVLETPGRNGTPGAENSRFAENIGPTFGGFRQGPPVPAPGQEVEVSVAAADPDGPGPMRLWWSVGGAAFRSAPMAPGADGLHRGKIPGQAAASLVQFYLEAEDGLGAVSTFPPGGPDSRALYRVEDGQARPGRVHNFRILMTPADTNLLHLETNVMSNQRLGSTVIYDEKEVYYDVGLRLKGSERGRPVSGRVGFNLRFHPDRPFRGVHESVAIDRSGGWMFGGPFGQDEIIIKHMAARAGGIPTMYDDLIRVIAPRSAQTGSALLVMAGFGDVFLDSQFQRGGEGTAWEFELIYYPTTTVDGNRESLKRPEPDQVLGTDIQDLGPDKEVYRWNFLIENNRARDDYGPIIALGKAFSLAGSSLEARTREVMDVDEWMRVFALYSLTGVNDTYTQGNNHNNVYYARPEDGKVLAFPWDMDFSFTRPTNAALWGDQNLSRVIQLPANQRLFHCHLRDIIDSSFNTAYMSRWTAHYSSLCGQDFAPILTYIGARASFVLGRLPAQVPFAITTQNGLDYSVAQVTTTIEGNAWYDAKSILVAERDDPPPLSWTTPTRWRAAVDLDLGANPLTFLALDLEGELVGSDTITVTSVAGNPAPAIHSVSPPEALAGETVTVTGSGFRPAIKVFFSGVQAPLVEFDAGADPSSLRARVPAIPAGPAEVAVQNSDGRSSAPEGFTVLASHRFVRGDLNLDGLVDLSDALRILLHLFRGAPADCRDAGDADDNEALDLADAIHVLGHLYLLGPAPRAPYPEPGEEPGGEGPLDCAAGLAP